MNGMPLPNDIAFAVNTLNAHGFEAFVVGGCVRDFLMGLSPHDFDITTNAKPDEVMAVFEQFRTIETGIKHGTVTVIIGEFPIEITTYRVDGHYSDNRRPDGVHFTGSLREDAARRDFTVNAICYNPQSGVVDFFGGADDIKRRVLRAVGDPEIRFSEDALRILRALRFASVLGFDIDKCTSEAIFTQKDLLKNISAERITVEFNKLICGENVRSVISRYYPVIGVVLPEILPMAGFEQHSKYHIYDVLIHSLVATENIRAVPHLRLSALLHDIGKPDTFFIKEDGSGHFYGHAKRSTELSEKLLTRFKVDNFTKERVLTLIKYHDAQIEHSEKAVQKWLGRLTPEVFFELLELKKADNSAQAPELIYRLGESDDLREIAKKIIAEKKCFSLRDLSVNGNDLIALDYSEGKEIGIALNELLKKVMSGELENDRKVLLSELRRTR